MPHPWTLHSGIILTRTEHALTDPTKWNWGFPFSLRSASGGGDAFATGRSPKGPATQSNSVHEGMASCAKVHESRFQMLTSTVISYSSCVPRVSCASCVPCSRPHEDEVVHEVTCTRVTATETVLCLSALLLSDEIYCGKAQRRHILYGRAQRRKYV